MRVAGIVLAAGHSKRMGGPNKLTAEVNGKPLVAHAHALLTEGGVDPVIVVTGHEERAVVHALGPSATVIHNPVHLDGMGTSVAAGVRAIPSVDALVIALADMPWVRVSTVHALIEAFRGDPETICIPVFGGVRGNPVLFGAAHRQALSECAGDVGARHLIAAKPEKVTEVPVDDPGILEDIDTPADLEANTEAP